LSYITGARIFLTGTELYFLDYFMANNCWDNAVLTKVWENVNDDSGEMWENGLASLNLFQWIWKNIDNESNFKIVC
jgi:hypothetical protein